MREGKDNSSHKLLTAPSGYYKLPNTKNIRQKPQYPYNLKTEGMIHSSKLNQLCRIIIEDNKVKEKYEQIQNLFSGFELDLSILEMDEIADFIRHLVYLNRDELGWDTADAILSELDKKGYYPRWELPGNDMDKDFRLVLKTIIDISLNKDENDLLLEFVTNVKTKTSGRSVEDSSINKLRSCINNNRWNMKQLSNLYETLNLMVIKLELFDAKKYQSILTKIENSFEKLMAKSSLEKSILINFIYVNGLINKDISGVIQGKTTLEKKWNELSRNQTNFLDDYKYLFGSFFAKIAKELYGYETDLVTRRRIVNELIFNYLKPREIDFQTWLDHLIKTLPHPLIFSYLVKGYSDVIFTLKEHAMDLILENARNEILEMHQDISKFLLKFIINYIKNYNNRFIGLDMDDFILDHIVNLQLPVSHVNDLIKSVHLANIFNLSTKTDSEFSEYELLELGLRILSSYYSHEHRYFFQLSMILDTGEFQYKRIIDKLQNEFIEEGTLLLCDTFEKEILQPFAILFNYVERNQQILGELEKYFIEILLWYIVEWFYQLTAIDEFSQEAALFMASFISILFTKLANFYIRTNQTIKSQLMILNEYYFWIASDHLGHVNYQKSLNQTVRKALTRLSESFTDLDFDFDPKKLNLKDVSSINLGTQKSSKLKILQDKERNLATTISQDLIMAYIERSDELRDFLNKAQNRSIADIKHLIQDDSPFTLPVDDHIDIFLKIGKNCPDNELKKTPFPLIREINSTALALSLFPFSDKLPLKFDKFS